MVLDSKYKEIIYKSGSQKLDKKNFKKIKWLTGELLVATKD